MDDILYNTSLVTFAIATIIYFRASKAPWISCIILAIVSPLLLMTFNALFTLISGLDFMLASLVLSLGFLIFAIKYALDKRNKENENAVSKTVSDEPQTPEL